MCDGEEFLETILYNELVGSPDNLAMEYRV